MINKFFDHIFCINLEKRPEKLKAAQKEFDTHGIQVEIVKGVDGMLLNDLPVYFSKEKEAGVVSKGDIGCTMSHHKVAMLAKERGYKNYLVFEDDVELIENFVELFNKFIQQIPSDWEMIYFGGNHDGGLEMKTENIAKIFHTYTTHAMGVNASAYDALISVLASANEKVDVGIASLHSKLNCYCFRPHLAFQREGFSDILQKESNYSHLRNNVFVPLGIRCSTAFVIKDRLHKRTMSLPFDWVDLPLASVLKLISINEDVDRYISEYIYDVKHQTHPDGTWFPHDFITTDQDHELRVAIMSKYIRRFNRLYNLFNSKNNLIFVTCIAYQKNENIQIYDQIKKVLTDRCKGSVTFITVNLTNQDTLDDNHFNLNVPFIDGEYGWSIWEENIAKKMNEYPFIKKILQ